MTEVEILARAKLLSMAVAIAEQYGGGNSDGAIFMKAFESVSAAWFIDNRDRL